MTTAARGSVLSQGERREKALTRMAENGCKGAVYIRGLAGRRQRMKTEHPVVSAFRRAAAEAPLDAYSPGRN